MNKSYFIIPLLYCAVMFFLLLQHINSQKNTTFSWGELTLTIEAKDAKHLSKNTRTLPAAGLETETAKVKVGKIKFIFNTSNKIITNNKPLSLLKILPLSTENGFSLLFGEIPNEKQETMSQTTDSPLPKTATITFQANEIFKDEIIISIHSENNTTRIPFKPPFGTKVKKSQGLSENNINTLSIPKTNGLYQLRILGQGKLQKNKTWEIKKEDSYSIVRYGPTRTNGFQSINRIPTIPNSVRKKSSEKITQYVDKAYIGWIDKRYDEGSGTYLQPEGVYGFSENALVSSFAEAKKRNEFIKNKLAFERSAYLYRKIRTWKSAPLRFDSPNDITNYINDMSKKQNNIQEAIQSKNYAILLDPSLLEIAHVFFTKQIQNELLSFLKNIPSWSLSPQIATSLLTQKAHTRWDELHAIITEKQSVLEQIIFENITVANQGYLLRQNEHELSVFYSILAGRYFADFGSTDALKNMGHRMIITALSLSDDVGFLPQIFVLKNKTTFSLGFLTPETIYKWLVKNPYYPRFYYEKLNSSATPSQKNNTNIILLSTAPVNITNKKNSIDIRIDITDREISQYLFIVQSPKPKQVYAFNTYWTGSYFINKISQGVYYDSKNNVTVVKMSSKNRKEFISFMY